MAPTRELSIETMERIIKLLQDGKPTRSVAKDVGCSQSAVCKIWCKYKKNGKVMKGKHTGRPRKTSEPQDRKLKAICLENLQCTTKQMRNQWAEIGVNVCDRTIRNRLNEMGLTYGKKHTQRILAGRIKEEPLSCEEDLPDTNSYTSTDYIPQDTINHIKEEPLSRDEDPTVMNSYTTTDHTQDSITHIKEEPLSCEKNLMDTNGYIPTYHTQHTTYIKEESFSCDEDLSEPNNNTSPDHTLQVPTTYTEEQTSSDKELLKPNSYKRTDHTQRDTTTHIEEEPLSCDEHLTNTTSYIPSDHTQDAPYIKEEPFSGDEEPTDLSQFLIHHIKEEPDSCNEVSLTHLDFRATTGCTQQYPSACSGISYQTADD